MPDDEFVVTPYQIQGKVDYDKLREQFGAQALDAALLERIKRLAGGHLHPLLARGIYYSHRDLGALLDKFEKGQPFFLYSGRGPSGPLHTSHLVPFELCRWIQEKFHVPMFIQITDDEKFWSRPGLTREETRRWGMENLADLLAVGFNPKRTHVFFDTRSIGAMYPLAVDVAKRIPVLDREGGLRLPAEPEHRPGVLHGAPDRPRVLPVVGRGPPRPVPHPVRHRPGPALPGHARCRREPGVPEADAPPQPDAPGAPR